MDPVYQFFQYNAAFLSLIILVCVHNSLSVNIIACQSYHFSILIILNADLRINAQDNGSCFRQS